MKRQNVRTLSLIVCTVTYLLVGAAVFDALESETELKQRHQVEVVKEQLMDKYNISEADYKTLELIIVRAIPHKAGHQWKFSGAFYFATTVITTIGYGHSCPMTIGGKIFCMFYALAGIPLGLVMFQSIGERLNTIAAKILRACKELCSRGNQKKNVTHTDLICICSALSVFLIAAGAWVFHSYEGWTYFDSLYYCFITLVTIGFGDFVALQKDGALQNRPEYVVFSLIFIVFGLTVISAAMNLLVLRFLTMNTEDEKRDQREAKLAAKGLVTINNLEGRRHYTRGTSSSSSAGSSEDDEAIHSISHDLHRHGEVTRLGLRSPLGDHDTVSIASCSCYQLRRGSESPTEDRSCHKRLPSTDNRRRSSIPKKRNTSRYHLAVQPFQHLKSTSIDSTGKSNSNTKKQNFQKSRHEVPITEDIEESRHLSEVHSPDMEENPFRPHRGHRHSNPFRGARTSQDINPFRDFGRADSNVNPFRDTSARPSQLGNSPIISAPFRSQMVQEDPVSRLGFQQTRF
ncbi:ion channel domain-containing protein [Ditylenchus destructor]|uniref:Ion channel domain-containing protein n=1 Tax=Ditylenchus destructor TaxID=166010 RepID=A0AAD4NJV6_9BILA|nr:ion channel domain-containing protein [Ditylenchus destructor]